MIEKISKLSEIKGDGGVFEFDASVLSIKYEGKKEDKRPLMAAFKLESTGEVFNAVSWNFQILDDLKSMSHALTVATFEATSTIYKDEIQVRVGKIKEILKAPSKQKKVSTASERIRDEITAFIKSNIEDQVCLNILDILVLKNDKFFTWPAASKVHHNFRGGLATHSLGTAKHALSYVNIYGTEAVDKDILLTGALIHDIGKLREYEENGDISFEGQFMSHLVSGVLTLDKVTEAWIPNERSDKVLLILKHIIMSHHDKLEFGSPVKPKCMEAAIISMCDLADSRYESLVASYRNIQPGTFSEGERVLDGSRIYKFKE